MRSILFSLFIICTVHLTSFSQPAFTNAGEIKVSQSPTTGDIVSIAVQQDGSCWVVWGSASQFLNSDLTFDGMNTNEFHDIIEPTSISNSKWGFINVRIVHVSNPIIFEYFHYYYFFGYDKNVIDTLTNLFVMHDYDNPNGMYESNELLSLSVTNHISKSVICANISKHGGVPSGHSETIHYLFLYDKQSGYNTLLFRESFWWIFKSYPNDMNMYFVSPFLKDRFAILKRIRADVTSENGIDYPYHRYIRTFSAAGDSLSKEVCIDTVAHVNTDYAEKILLGTRDDVYLFRRHQRYGDSIFVRNASIDGSVISKEKFLLNHVVSAELNSFYNVANLSQGRILIVWDAFDTKLNKVNVYCGLLDVNMNWLGQPKRINSDTTGDHWSSSIALKGDTVYVAWIDTRDGSRQVYMRRFQADQITKTEAIKPPTEFSLSQNYPNPFSTSTTIQFSIANNGGTQSGGSFGQVTSLRIYDALGREVKTIFDDVRETGNHHVVVDSKNLSNGIYFYRLVGEKFSQTRAMTVLK